MLFDFAEMLQKGLGRHKPGLRGLFEQGKVTAGTSAANERSSSKREPNSGLFESRHLINRRSYPFNCMAAYPCGAKRGPICIWNHRRYFGSSATRRRRIDIRCSRARVRINKRICSHVAVQLRETQEAPFVPSTSLKPALPPHAPGNRDRPRPRQSSSSTKTP